ncbi:MAG: phage tail tape measure protein [Gemmatimonadaceae bacterium]
MADRQFTFAVLLRGFDFVSAPLRRVVSGIHDVEATAKRARSLGALSSDLKGFGENMQRLGVITGGAGAGLGIALGLHQVPGQAIAAEHALLAIGNTAGLSDRQIREAHLSLRGLSKEANQYQADLIAGLGVLTASGLDFATAMSALPGIGRTATAESAGVADIANTSFAIISNMKLQVGDLAKTLDQLAAAGHLGQFELRDMAQYFPALTASAGTLGLKGAPSILSLAAALQIARRGAGDSATAANNLKNFLDKLGSPEVQRNFQKLGVSVKEEFVGAITRGEDPILHMVQLVQRLTGGDAFRLGELFQDIQVQSFLKPMLQNLTDFQKIKAEAAKGGVVHKDFERIMKSVAEQTKALRINMAATAMPLLEGPLSIVNGLLTTINKHPGLQKLLLFTTVGLIGFGGGALVISSMVRALGVWASTLGTAGRLLNGLSHGLRGAQTLWAANEVMQMRSARVGAFLTATWLRLNVVLAANPIGAIVLGVGALVGVTVLLWRNWTAVTRFIKANPLFSAGLAVVSPVMAMLTGTIALVKYLMRVDLRTAGAQIVRGLWEGMQSLAGKPIELMRWIATKLRALLPFSPAKEGPLRDLHRIRMIETIAATMQPWPMVNAMRRAASLTAAAALLPAGAGATSLPNASSPIAQLERAELRRAASAGGQVAFTYAPVLHIAAGAPAETVTAVRRLLDADRAELQRLVRDIVIANGHRDARKAQ